ncbi:MAG: hypothetical protein WKF77_14235 [Planctomycetaceae bacterium]
MSVSDLLKSFSRVTREKNRRRPSGHVAMFTEQFETRSLLSSVTIFGSELAPPPIGGSTGGGTGGNTLPLTNLPLLNSRPGAPVSVILKMDGYTDNDPGWIGFRNRGTGPIVTPAFDLDGDALTFNAEELRQIEEIWYRVAEDFSPFNINVTTIAPPTLNDFEHVMVVIGGSNDWAPAAGGWGAIDGFSTGSANTNYIFSGLFFNPHQIASAASHETGHTFGLQHQSLYDANGNKTAEYDPGDAASGPIMGVGYGTIRDTWRIGTSSTSATSIQDDLAYLTRSANRTVQYRTDDFGNTIPTAFQGLSSGSTLSVNGVLERNDDVDMFEFETNTGTISFSVDGLNLRTLYKDPALTFGTNLDLALSLYDSSGVLITQISPTTSLSATFSVAVGVGSYYVAVSNNGEYGAIGQYTLTGNVLPLPSTPTMIGPVGTLTQAVPFFEWTIGANADYYQLQVDNLTLNRTGYYTRDVTTTSHMAENQFQEGDYRARVRTIADDGTFSAWSNYIAFSIDIPVPAAPRLIRPVGDITESFPTFEWIGDANSSNFTLWVNNATTQTRIIYRTAYAGTVYVHFDPLPDGVYRAWVKATNAVGESGAWSEFVEFTIDSPIPNAPKITAPIAVTTSVNPRIVWTAVEGAARYDLWVNNLTTGKGQYIRQANISRLTPYYDPAALPQGSYTAWVRAANGNNEFSAWSTPYTFTVDVMPPGTPRILGPTGPIVNLTITTANPTFTWTAVERAVKYDLWVNNLTTGQFQIIRQQNLTETQYVALDNLPQGNYRAWVRGINSANEVGEWSTVYVFSIDEPTPLIPVITAPVPNAAGSVENPNPTFLWTTEFDAPLYEFRLDDVTLNRTNVIRVNNLKTKSYTIPNNLRLAEHTYVAMVRGVNASGEMSDWSAPYRVRIDVPNPTTPSIIGPSGTSRDTTPTFQWNHDRASFRYEILVRDLERGESIVLQVRTLALNPTGKIAFYTLPDNQAFKPSTYRFWIRAFSSIGTASSWSDSQSFVISASLDLKTLKLVDPAKLEAAEEHYAATEFAVEPASDAWEAGTKETSSSTRWWPKEFRPSRCRWLQLKSSWNRWPILQVRRQ